MTNHDRTSLHAIRKDYSQHALDEASVPSDPLAFFAQWFDEALAAQVNEPNAMTLSTVDADGFPSARIVLLKALDNRGFSFFTNRSSRKGRAIAHESRVALTFFWPELERQVRVQGRAELLSDEECDAYWATRPRASQLGAWASPQSEAIDGRAQMESRFAEAAARFEGKDVERPTYWGGYLIVPSAIEFWQGRRSRMHDRIAFTREPKSWKRARLSP
ncbi:MAG: pyridoxamine 5'-phosphate oxidase [Myxococcales bacterium]|nr:pyridoxamine 5'-phosphate oxidase [Myxococcales bacterium]